MSVKLPSKPAKSKVYERVTNNLQDILNPVTNISPRLYNHTSFYRGPIPKCSPASQKRDPINHPQTQDGIASMDTLPSPVQSGR